MLEYDRIGICEGIDVNKNKYISKNVVYAIFISFWIKTLIMDHIYVMVAMICL